jgi:hypothetical protein
MPINIPLPIEKGGTSASTATGILAAIGAASETATQTALDGKAAALQVVPVKTGLGSYLVIPASDLDKQFRIDNLGGLGEYTIVLPDIGISNVLYDSNGLYNTGSLQGKRLRIELSHQLANGTQYSRKKIIFRQFGLIAGDNTGPIIATVPELSINSIGAGIPEAFLNTRFHEFEVKPNDFTQGLSWYYNSTENSTRSFVGASASLSGLMGLVPTPANGDENKFLRGDATWSLPPGVSAGLSANGDQDITGILTSSLANNNVRVPLGFSTVAYVRNDGANLTKGEAVYIAGAQGDRAKVKKANNLSDETSARTFGLAAQSIASGADGYILTNGQLQNLSILTGFNAGDMVWLGSGEGTLTKTKPHAPQHAVFLGVVERPSNGNNGIMYVKVQNGYEIDELHDVRITSQQDNDLLVSESGLWVNKPIGSTSNLLATTGSHGLMSSIDKLKLDAPIQQFSVSGMGQQVLIANRNYDLEKIDAVNLNPEIVLPSTANEKDIIIARRVTYGDTSGLISIRRSIPFTQIVASLKPGEFYRGIYRGGNWISDLPTNHSHDLFTDTNPGFVPASSAVFSNRESTSLRGNGSWQRTSTIAKDTFYIRRWAFFGDSNLQGSAANGNFVFTTDSEATMNANGWFRLQESIIWEPSALLLAQSTSSFSRFHLRIWLDTGSWANDGTHIHFRRVAHGGQSNGQMARFDGALNYSKIGGAGTTNGAVNWSSPFGMYLVGSNVTNGQINNRNGNNINTSVVSPFPGSPVERLEIWMASYNGGNNSFLNDMIIKIEGTNSTTLTP